MLDKTQPSAATYARGALFGLAAVSIWAGNMRRCCGRGLGLGSNLTPWDISAIRFAVAGAGFLLPLSDAKRSCPGSPRLDRIGGARAWWRAYRPARERGIAFCASVTCGRALSRRHATDGPPCLAAHHLAKRHSRCRKEVDASPSS